jgi:hypothetical protein
MKDDMNEFEKIINELFKRTQTLIENQRNMLIILDKLADKIIFLKKNKECQHESDGMNYMSKPPCQKCKKCGAIYI